MSSSLRLVLDTNVVLDWLVFDDPSTRELEAALRAQRVALIVNTLTHEELQRVLSYPQLNLDAARQLEIGGRYLSEATAPPMPAEFSRDQLLLPSGFPLCRDSDDDRFLALAYHSKATLITKDKALLKLSKRAIRFQVPILHERDLHRILQ